MWRPIKVVTAESLELFDIVRYLGEFFQIVDIDATSSDIEFSFGTIDGLENEPIGSMADIDRRTKIAVYEYVPE